MEVFAIWEIFAIVRLRKIQTSFLKGDMHEGTGRTIRTIGGIKIRRAGFVRHQRMNFQVLF